MSAQTYTVNGLLNDFNSLYGGKGVGFEGLFDQLSSLTKTADNYPPYSVIRLDKDNYLIEMAVAGFKKNDIVLTIEEGKLSIVATVENVKDTRDYLYRGLARRSFTRSFILGEYVEVSSANIVDGILTVKLARIVPEGKKARKIPVG